MTWFLNIVSGFILPACMVNVQIDGVINVGRRFSYHYEVIIPDQKDILKTNTSRLRSSIQQQEQIQEKPRTDKHEQPSNRAKPDQAEINEQLRIIDNSRKHATSGSYFNTSNKHLSNQHPQTKQQNEKQEQLRSQAQPGMQGQIHNNNNFRKHVSPYFTSTNEPLFDRYSRVEIQPQPKLSPPEHEQLRFREQLMQDRFQHDTISRIQDISNLYTSINPGNDRILEQQAEVNKQFELDRNSRLQEQSHSRERYQMAKDSRLQNNPNFDIFNGRLLSQRQQIKQQAEEQQEAQEYKQTQLQEQQRMQERISIDKNEGMQDVPNVYINPVNGQIIYPQQQIKKQSTEQEQSREHQQIQEQSQNNKSLRMSSTSNPENSYFEWQVKKELEEREQSLEHRYLRFQNQPQMQKQFQINVPLLKQEAINSYFNANEQQKDEQLDRQMKKQFAEQEESQEGKSPRSQEQHHIQERFSPQIKEMHQIETKLRTQGTSHTYFNPVNEIQAQQLHMKQQSDRSEQSITQSQQPIQEVYEIDKSLRTLNASNTYFSPPNAQPLSQHVNTQFEEQEQSKEDKLLQLQEQAHMLESSQIDKNYQIQDRTNQANGGQLVQRSHMKTRSEEEHSEENEHSELQEQPMMQFYGVDENSRTRDTNKYSFPENEGLIVEHSHTQEQSVERSHSQEYEQSQGQEQSRTPGNQYQQSQIHKEIRNDDQSRIAETPNSYSQPLNKGLLDEQDRLQKQSVKHHESHQSRITDMLQFEKKLRTQQTSISYFDDVQNKPLPEELSQQKEQIQSHHQSNGYQQTSSSKGESRELGHRQLHQDSKLNEPPQRPEHTQFQERPRAYEQSSMQEKSIVYKQPVPQTTRNPYIISVNKRLEEDRIQRKQPDEPTILSQIQGQLPVMLLESQQLPGYQLNEHLQTQETLNSYSNAVNKPPSMQEQLLRQVQSGVKGLSKEEYSLQLQQPPQKRNQSRMQDLTIFQLSRIQGQSQGYNEKTKKPHFHSINKRILDEQSQGKESSNVHFVNKHLSNGQLQVQEQSRSSQKQRVHETANPYFKSINKRLEDMQSETQKTSNRHFHSVKIHLTTEVIQEVRKTTARKEVTVINPYIHSVNKRFTDDEAQEQLQPGHKLSTTNPYIHSVNKRLTTGETDDRFHSDYDDIPAEWFETSATTKHKKIHHHDEIFPHELAAHHEHHQHHQHHGAHDQRKGESTPFADLTVRKKKRQHTTTLSHGHGHNHHRNKTLLNMYPKSQRENTKLDTMHTKITFKGSDLLRTKNKLTTSSTFQEHKQLNKTKSIILGFQDLFTIKDYNLNLLRKEKNSSKQNHIQNKNANNKTSEISNSKALLFKQMVTQMITNLTYHDIFGHPLKIKNDTQIKTFTMHILQSGLSVFAVLKEKATDWSIKRKFDELAETYEKKYKEFLTDTCRHEIKSSLGKQKVILNAIDVSDRILKRLFNFVVADMDQRGHLRDNIATAINFQQEVDKETNLEFNHVCKKFGICKTGNGFPKFLVEYLTVILKCDDTKFKLAMDSLTELTKNIDFSDIFQKTTRHIIRSTVNRVELLDVKTLRPAFMIVKNIVANKNRPLAVSKSESHSSKINSTLSLLAIIDILEDRLPRTDANIIEWGDLTSGLNDWLQDRRTDVVDIMEKFVNHIMSAFNNMSVDQKEHIARNLERVVNVY